MTRVQAGDRRWPAWLALISVLAGGVAVMWWRCVVDVNVPYLTAQPPAEWILHPRPFRAKPRDIKDERVRFRTTFELSTRMVSGSVTVRAFGGYRFWINGFEFGSPPRQRLEWKRACTHDVTRALRLGKNEIEVDVVQDRGPPALWLLIHADQTTIATGTGWQARIDSEEWQTVRRAGDPLVNPLALTLPTTAEGWRQSWPLLALLTMVAAVATGVGWWWSRRSGAEPLISARAPLLAGPHRLELTLVSVVGVLWVVLCANNLYQLPPVIGHDATSHLAYVRFLLAYERLPLASDGWEMYQPPLYYLVSALLIPVARSLDWADAVTGVPKVINMFIGIGQVIVVWLALRILFPASRRARCAGLIMAAGLPVNLYMAQAPSNEMACTLLVSVAIVIALRMFRDQATGWRPYALLGVMLGLGMLAKYTALLAIVAVLVAVVFHSGGRWRSRLGAAGVTVFAVVIVAGWMGVRNWVHYGNPLIGNWDPVSGHRWWQDPGCSTSAYLFHFGRVLREPFLTGANSFPGGVYSTVWGDGLLSGNFAVQFRVPWHYHLMAIGYTLALLPILFMAVGFAVAIVEWLRRPNAAWTLLGGHGLLMAFALLNQTLALPYYSVVKGSYAMTATTCVCALGGWGFDRVGRWIGRAAVVLWVPLLAWGLVACASFFVWPVDARTHYALGQSFASQGKAERALDQLREAVRLDPTFADAYGGLGSLMIGQHRYREARRVLDDGLRRDPNNIEVLRNLAWLLAACPDPLERDGRTALKLAERACRVTGYKDPFSLRVLAAAQAEVGQLDEAARTVEKAITLAEAEGQQQVLADWRSWFDALRKHPARPLPNP